MELVHTAHGDARDGAHFAQAHHALLAPFRVPALKMGRGTTIFWYHLLLLARSKLTCPARPIAARAFLAFRRLILMLLALAADARVRSVVALTILKMGEEEN